MNLDITQLRALVAIVDFGGVGHAAEKLGFTQGAVSIQIKRLEEKVNEKIFTRKGRGVMLTPAGDILIRYARQILDLNDKAISHIQYGSSSEILEVGIPPDLSDPYLPIIIRRFKKAYPNISLHPQFANTTQLLDKFNQGLLDFFIGIDVSGHGKEIVRVPVSWFFSGDEAITALRPLPIVTGENTSARRMISQALDEADISHEYVPGAADVFASAAIVQAGLAVTVMVDRPEGTDRYHKVPCGLLPELPDHGIYIYRKQSTKSHALSDLTSITENVFISQFKQKFN